MMESKVPGTVYFLGIGGIGMSALARYFASLGASVSGYDKTITPLTGQLISEGMKIHFTEDINLIPPKPDLVVYTPAIPADHAEFVFIREKNFPLKKRAEVLGMIADDYRTVAVAGTHGKTTTSTLIAHILHAAGVNSVAILGGVPTNYGTNFLITNGESDTNSQTQLPPGGSVCVVEADEFDRSFLHLNPEIAVITSADADHLDIYGNQDEMRSSFGEFTSKVVSGGTLVMKSGILVTPVNSNGYTIYTYDVSGSAFHAANIMLAEGLFHFDFMTPRSEIKGLVLGIPGRFNLENSIAALAVCHLLGVSDDALRSALKSYQGVQRRFEFRVRRPGKVYIDDYAHHPEELKACITAVRELYPGETITGVFQPHLFSRTRDFADEFARSLELLDELILLDIYPARELPIEGITSQMLLDRVNLRSKILVKKEDLLNEIARCKPTVLLSLGAGDIDQFAGPIARLLSEPTVHDE